MSWIYAIIGSGQAVLTPQMFEEVHANPLFVVRTPWLYLAAGGIPDTCLYKTAEASDENGWAVVGLGIEVSDVGARLMDVNNWAQVLSEDTPWSTSLNGHFAAIRWKNRHVECFTDELGQRTLYFGKCKDGLCISTRVDWVARTTGQLEIDYSSLGSKWLTFNQLDYGSCITGIGRLGPRGHAVFKNENILKNLTTPWLPDFSNGGIDRAITILSSLLRGAMNHHGRQVSLGLSGGIDSRLLLAQLMAVEGHRFGVHTFGSPNDPDVVVSSSIAGKLGLEREYLDEPLPDAIRCVAMLKAYAAQACFVEPASSFVKLRYYPRLREQGRLLVDGGFGEIARRQYLNRVVRFGRRALRGKNISKLFSLVRVDRGDIFADDLKDSLLRGAHDGLEHALRLLPSTNDIGVENSADLLAVRTRIPNYGAAEQARLDGDVINFMPLVQPSFLRAVFAARVRLRSNGKFYRDIIRKSSPMLARVPLVKSGTTYPFELSTPSALLLTKIKSRFGKRFTDSVADQLLSHIQEFVLDTAHSQAVVGWPGYKGSKIRDATEAYYYHGDIRLRNSIDWWLAFQLWRSSLSDDVHTQSG